MIRKLMVLTMSYLQFSNGSKLSDSASLDVYATVGGGSNLLGAIDLFYGNGFA